MAANLKDLPRRYYTLAEYFALEQVGDARYEYWDGDILCMSGGTERHYLIAENLRTRLADVLKSRQCRALSGGVPIHTPSLPPYRYPDVSVVCGKPAFVSLNGIDALTNPILVIEVLSPGTELLDRNQKKDAYQALPSVQEYLLIAQDEPHVTQFVRTDDGWRRRDFSDLQGSLELPSINCRLALGDIYEGVVFD
ncbi:MAG TPA: Uma2 family endonuclease [Blastocatellia bacterium]|nr:Uma2 family endonuclease [Blastocatellia bacterium]